MPKYLNESETTGRLKKGAADLTGDPSANRRDVDQHERRLIAQIAHRDARAFEQLFFAYHPRIHRFCYRIVGRQSLAEELVNDVMLVVWRKAGNFAKQSRVSTWIFGIAYRQSLRALRKQKILNLFTQNESAIDQASVDSSVLLSHQQDWIKKGFKNLTPKHRAVIELAYFGGYGCAEIADIMRCPVNTVKTRMFYARKRLANTLPALAEETMIENDHHE